MSQSSGHFESIISTVPGVPSVPGVPFVPGVPSVPASILDVNLILVL